MYHKLTDLPVYGNPDLCRVVTVAIIVITVADVAVAIGVVVLFFIYEQYFVVF